MTNYDNNPRYDKIDDETYFDNETGEVVFLLSDEASEAFANLPSVEESNG